MTSACKYYDLWFDEYIPEKWYIRTPDNPNGQWILHREFFQGKPVHLGYEPFIPVSRPGPALDYSVTGTGVVVLNQRLASVWEKLDVREDVQLIPARVEGQEKTYFIVNTLRIIRCVDEARCRAVTFWEPEHGRPEMVGQYRNVRGLKIDPASVGDANIFRPWGWECALIISERVKRAMEQEGITGAEFIEV